MMGGRNGLRHKKARSLAPGFLNREGVVLLSHSRDRCRAAAAC